MGRAFEFRKARKMKRWSSMAKTFTRIGKDIVMAVKAGGPDPATNSRLRAVVQNAKAANMPKTNVESAIKRASSKDQEDYKEIVLEGYAMHGVAVLVECTTDNNNRTVANVRSYFSKTGGSLGTNGMLDFIFERKCLFKIANKAISLSVRCSSSLSTVLEFGIKKTPDWLDTYFIGDGGSNLEIFQISIQNQNIYAATADGIYQANLTNPLLVDFRNWKKHDALQT